MFGRKKANKLIEDIDRYFDLMGQSVVVFKDGVRNYLYSNTDEFNANLMRMSAIDSDAAVLRREIENSLYTQTALVRSRADMMRLFEKTRHITDLLNDSLFQSVRTQSGIHQAYRVLHFGSGVRHSGSHRIFQKSRAGAGQDQPCIFL